MKKLLPILAAGVIYAAGCCSTLSEKTINFRANRTYDEFVFERGCDKACRTNRVQFFRTFEAYCGILNRTKGAEAKEYRLCFRNFSEEDESVLRDIWQRRVISEQ